MKDSTILALAGIGGLTVITVACIFQGIDHLIVGGVCSLIAGIAGYELKARRG